MKKITWLLILLPQFLWAQDTIKPILIENIEIIASRNQSTITEIPAQTEVLNAAKISKFPVVNFDNLLQSIPNVYVNRSWGIFSKNASVTMRGLDGSNRVLVLLNGTPLNKASGGGINWYMINTETVQQLEILKGSNSALYGNNAMSGIISIVSRIPQKKLEGSVTAEFGMLGTFGAQAYVGASGIKNEKGWFAQVYSNYRKGSGYIIVSETERDSTDIALYIAELSNQITVGYKFNKKWQISTQVNQYNDIRADGISVYEPKGGFTEDNAIYCNTKVQFDSGKLNFQANAFVHYDYSWQHTERLNQTGDTYRLWDVYQKTTDAGIWSHVNYRFSNKHKLTAGVDLKTGYMFANEVYRTSLDNLDRRGQMNFAAVFLQEQLKIGEKWHLVAAIRFDAARFRNGSFSIQNPSRVSGYTADTSAVFANNTWKAFSPKIAVKYLVTSNFNLFASVSRGFMPPKLDDMISSRKINKGFKIANPYLLPETLYSYETGWHWNLRQNLLVEHSFYVSSGTDFMYFVEVPNAPEAAFLDDADKRVYIRSNLAGVRVLGTEAQITWQIGPNFSLRANYTFNESKIRAIKVDDNSTNALLDKYLVETPMHQAFLGCEWNNKIANVYLSANYVGSQWADEENTQELKPYFTTDIRISREFSKHLIAILDVQDILNQQYIDKKGGLSPGTFVLGKIGFKF